MDEQGKQLSTDGHPAVISAEQTEALVRLIRRDDFLSVLSKLPLDEIHDFNQRERDRWVTSRAGLVAPGSRVLDVGAGTCPYRNLFAHCDYRTHDFTKYEGPLLHGDSYGEMDYVSDVAAIPVADGSFDVLLCTEVLEHVPAPIEAVAEFSRILKPGGTLLLTAPLGSSLHQTPFHFYGGYTPFWYERYLDLFGFQIRSIEPNGGFFRHLAQECARVSWTSAEHKEQLTPDPQALLFLFGELLPRYLYALDSRAMLPEYTIGYHIHATRLGTSAEALQRIDLHPTEPERYTSAALLAKLEGNVPLARTLAEDALELNRFDARAQRLLAQLDSVRSAP